MNKLALFGTANEILNQYILEEIMTFFKKEQLEFIEWEEGDIFGAVYTEKEVENFFPILYNEYKKFKSCFTLII